MKTIKVTIQGISPLLMHRFPMPGKDDKPKKKTGVPDWEAEAETYVYKGKNGEIYQPASHLEGCLKVAGRAFTIQGKRGATYSKLMGSSVSVEPEAIPHVYTDYDIDKRRVIVQRAAVIRFRPVFKKWELSFNIVIQDEQISDEIVKQILDHAGLYVGIGDYRPDRGGKFGKFMVTEFKELKAK